MATNNKKKKTAAAIAVAAVLLLGGTFAWQSISQTALNEASDVINPGGRLHDDFNGTNKDVYVENFTDAENGGQPIFARVRLDEYFEVVMNKGTNGQVETVVTKDADGNDAVKDDKTTWPTHKFGETNATDDFWDWATGGSTVFMPTFNKNKDSLVADINGTYNGQDGTVTDEVGDDRYSDYVDYSLPENSEKTAEAIYDSDSNDADEVGADLANASSHALHVKTIPEDHSVKNTQDAALISMSAWLTMVEGDGGYDMVKHGQYWVYDEDGWVYWSAPIKPGMATGLLLDGIKLDNIMDDSWYYGINVIGQFITRDDIGSIEDNDGLGSGFFKKDEGPVPSSKALQLLDKIGVEVDSQRQPQTYDLRLNWAENAYVNAQPGDSIILSVEKYADEEVEYEGDLAAITVIDYNTDVALEEGTDYTYDANSQTLIITTEAVDVVQVRDNTGNYAGFVYFNGEGGNDDEDEDFYGAPITVDGFSPNGSGYIYLSGLDIDQNNSFNVEVNKAYNLVENGLTATFHESEIKDTTMVIDPDDPYSAVLTIAARDYHSVTITAEFDDGETESVIVVPIYNSIVITPDMDGETVVLPSGLYSLEAEDFDAEPVSFNLTGAKRSNIVQLDGQDKLNITSYESSTEITLTATDGDQTAKVKIEVLDAHPYDGPIYTYYVLGQGETWAYAFMETQDYAWEQNDGYTYQVRAGMTNDFAGTIDWNIVGATTDGSVYFVDEAGNRIENYSGVAPNIKFTTGQTDAFKLTATIYADKEKNTIMTDENGNPYNADTQYFTIYPTKEGKPVVRYLSVSCDDSEYGHYVSLAPGESTEVYFGAHMRDDKDEITNADVSWSLFTKEEGCSFEIAEGNEDENTAVVTHTCTENSCTKIGAVEVIVSYDHAYGQECRDFSVIPEEYAGDLEFGPSGGEGEGYFDSGNLTLTYDEIGEEGFSLAGGESIVITIEGYEEMSLFDWEIVEGGVYEVSETSGTFRHYEEGTDEWNSCPCTTVIKATLKTDPSVWGAIEIPCA